MQPYTYLIEFIPTGNKYYGVKFSKDSDPNLFWKNYFTSSKVIKDLIEKHGVEAFSTKVDKVFDTPEEAIKYELQYLQSIEDKSLWLNQNFGSGYDINRALYKTEEHRRKISIGNKKPKTGKALKACLENGKLGAEARRGQRDSYEVRKKRSESLSKSLTGVERPNRRKSIIIGGIEYIGVKAVTEKYNVTRQTVYNRIKSEDWNWHYATAD
jgi:hypothetical protein